MLGIISLVEDDRILENMGMKDEKINMADCECYGKPCDCDDSHCDDSEPCRDCDDLP